MAGAVDFHVHVQPWDELRPEVRAGWIRQRPDAEWLERVMREPAEFVRYLDRCGVEKAVLINYPSPDLMGFTDATNDFVARYRDEAPDRIVACGGVHPVFTRRADDARAKMDRLLGELRLSLVKLHPPHQMFALDDYRRGNEVLPVVFEKAAEHGVPVMIHTGTSIFPGARSRLGDPMPLDDLCLDFPRTIFVMAHLGRPLWPEEAFFLLRRHRNLWADCSGIPPKGLLEYFPRLPELADKVMFGSDWPSPGVKDLAKNLEEFRALPLPAEAKEKILRENAMRLLGMRR